LNVTRKGKNPLGDQGPITVRERGKTEMYYYLESSTKFKYRKGEVNDCQRGRKGGALNFCQEEKKQKLGRTRRFNGNAV